MSDEISEIENVVATVSKLIDAKNVHEMRLAQIEQDLSKIENLINGDVSKKTKRAIKLREVLKDQGQLTRSEAQRIFDNAHHKVVLDAMKEAAKLYDDLILTKNNSNRWVLAVKK